MPNPQVPALHLSIHWVWSQVSCWCSCPSCEQRSQRGVSKVKLIFCDWFELFCQVWWSRDHCQHDFDWSVLWRGRCMESSSYNLLWENLLWCCLNKRPMASPLGKTKLSCWPIVLLKETKTFLATRLLYCVQWGLLIGPLFLSLEVPISFGHNPLTHLINPNFITGLVAWWRGRGCSLHLRDHRIQG